MPIQLHACVVFVQLLCYHSLLNVIISQYIGLNMKCASQLGHFQFDSLVNISKEIMRGEVFYFLAMEKLDTKKLFHNLFVA